jgi:hypothetical protein
MARWPSGVERRWTDVLLSQEHQVGRKGWERSGARLTWSGAGSGGRGGRGVSQRVNSSAAAGDARVAVHAGHGVVAEAE